MPADKCVIAVTDARGRRARKGPRGGTRKPARTGVEPPEWPRKGDLVECEWPSGPFRAVVLEVKDNKWNPPDMKIMTDDGAVITWQGPHVKILSRRRRPTGKRKKHRHPRTKD